MAKKLTTFQRELREKAKQVQKQIRLRHAAEKKAASEERKAKHRAAVAEKKAKTAEKKAKRAQEKAQRAEHRELKKQGRLTRAVRHRKPTRWNNRVSNERKKLHREHPDWSAKHLLGAAAKEASKGYRSAAKFVKKYKI